MSELIKITKNSSNLEVVSAKELYSFLELDKSQWARWRKRNITNNEFALKNIDYTELDTMSRSVDYALTIDFAKKLAMLARNEKGEKVRDYFILREKQAKDLDIKPQLPDFTNPAIAARAWAEQYEAREIAEAKSEKQQKQLEEQKPKVNFYDAVTESKDAIDIGSAAKVLDIGYGRNKLFEKLRNLKILMSNNQPYQKYVDCGYFRVIETKFTKPDGSIHINLKTLVYQNGLDFINSRLNRK